MSEYADPSKRVGNAQRDRYVDHLANQVAGGYLRQHEFEERRDKALEAITYGDLFELVRDLPAVPQPKDTRISREVVIAVNGRPCHVKTWAGVTAFFIVAFSFTGPVFASIWHGFGHAPWQGGLPVLLMMVLFIAGAVWGVCWAPEYKKTVYEDA